MDIAGDLVSAGVDILNIQDRVNGIERMERELKGKVALEVDVDRQRLLPFGTPREIEAYIKSVVLKLGSRRGGLLFSAEVLHDVPLRNIEALLDSLEKYAELHKSLPV
jgi:uroporphyrinogen-III decarboxylase